MRHLGFLPQLGRAIFQVVAQLKLWVGASRRGCVVAPELKVPCVQSRRFLVAELIMVREELLFPVGFRGQTPQCRRRLLLLLVLTEVFRREKFWLIDHIWIDVKLRFIRSNKWGIFVREEFAEPHVMGALCGMGSIFAYDVI